MSLKSGNKFNIWPFLPWLLFVAGLSFTLFAARYVWVAGEAEDRQRFQKATMEIANAVKSMMEVHEAVLRGTAGFFGANESVSPEQFRKYVGRLLLRKYYPGVQQLGFIERQYPDKPYEPTLLLHTSPDGTLPATSASVVSVKFLEPVGRNLVSLDALINTTPAMRAAMQSAGDNGIPVVAAPVALSHGVLDPKQLEVVMFIPVYKNGGIPASQAARRSTLLGFTVALSPSRDLFKAMLKGLPPTSIKLRATDTTFDKPVFLFETDSESIADGNNNSRFTDVRNTAIRGRNWRLEFFSPYNYGSSYLKGAFPATAVAGTIFSFLILMFGLGQVRARQHAEEAIGQLRTSEHELQEASTVLEWKVAERTNTLERTISDQALMKEFTDQLQACFTIEEAGSAIQHFSAKLFPGWSGSMTLLRSSKNLIEVISRWGEDATGQSMFAPDDCWALRRGRPHHVEDGGSGVACSHFEDFSGMESLCVPMLAQGDTIGTLHLCRRVNDHRMDGERQLAVIVAEHVGLVLANIKLREVLRAQSVRDPLTNLFNRRYMEASIERELARCIRNSCPLSVMMLDLDHFKKFNDTYGHEVGDEILRRLSHILQTSVRSEDIACRYGGEEFLIIMPDATLQEALERAENIRVNVADTEIRHRNEIYKDLTISIGVASYPDHGMDATSLVRKADTALYQAKAEGRNKVKQFDEGKA